MTDQLLPCPFCGSPAEFSGRNAAGELCPACSMCSCRALSVLDWNTRAQPVARDKLLEEVTQLLREVANYPRHPDYDWYIEDINAVDAIINTTSTEGKDHD